jgi:hypothetical protein
MFDVVSGNLSGKDREGSTVAAKRSTVQRFRARQKARGLRRFEVQVPAEDVSLVRRVAAALADPARRLDVRAALGEVVGIEDARSLKALLAQAPPLDDIDLTRSRDAGRAIDL